MIPSRPRLMSWNFDALITTPIALRIQGVASEQAAVDISKNCDALPTLRAWEGTAHTAAVEAFGRARREGAEVCDLADGLAGALETGYHALTTAKRNLLDKVADIEAGQFHVTDGWVVLLNPVEMSSDELRENMELRNDFQIQLNSDVITMGAADHSLATGLQTAAKKAGYVQHDPNLMELVTGSATPEPQSDVPNPLSLPGQMYQQHIRDEDAAITITGTETGTNAEGEPTKTLHMQDGSKKVFTETITYAGSSTKRPMYVEEDFDPSGKLVATTRVYKTDFNADVTSITYADGTLVQTMKYPDGTQSGMVFPSERIPNPFRRTAISSRTLR
ncbi:hypothetical protein ACLQ3C_11635 [Gordonia sp. DT30]|uniref:hypothetical protein n=1 Tax=Gordonia sp. DT30 TaxID=3416546 RepID=UPI003CEDBDE9